MNKPLALLFIHYVDRFNERLCRAVSWFTLLMALLTFLIVVLRYGFNLGWIAMQESVMYFHALVFFVGAAHTLKVNEHVRVDVFYRRFSAKRKALTDLFGTLLLQLPVNLFILLMSWQYVFGSWQLLEGSPESGGLPLVFLLKTFILLFALLMALQGVAELLRNALVLKNEEHPMPAHGGE